MNMKLANETKTQVYAILFAVAFAALLASGCSTPVVSGNSSQPDTSDAYTKCRQVMTSYGQSTYQCDSVMSSNYGTSSYNQYAIPSTPYYPYVAPAAPYYGKASTEPSTEQSVQAYKDYLATLNAEALADMNAQWNALIAQSH